MSDLSVSDWLLLAAAILGTVWALVPALAFFLGATRIRHHIREEPGLAEPTADDPDYERRYRQLAELGFRPVGSLVEKCWFINPFEWYHQSRIVRWLALPDGKAFASCHRLADDEPVRFGFLTVLSGDGMVRTTCPGAGLQTMEENWLRVEVQNVEPDELQKRHQQNVELFCAERGLKVQAATFRDASAVDEAYDNWSVRHSGGGSMYQIPLLFFILPVLFAVGFAGWFGFERTDWRTWATCLCIATAVFGFVRKVVFPALFRIALTCNGECADEEPASAP